MSGNAERMARIERRYEEVKRQGGVKQSEANTMSACWSCRYREWDWSPTSFLCDCDHPLRAEVRARHERQEPGNCGPDALLYRHPTFNLFKWVRFLLGQRPKRGAA